MRKWIAPALAFIIVIFLVFNGIFYLQSNGELNKIQDQVSGLQTGVSDIPAIQSDLNSSKGDISSLQSDMTSVQNAVSNLITTITGIVQQISSLQTIDTGISQNVSSMQTAISQLSTLMNPTTVDLPQTVKMVEPTVVRLDTNVGPGSGVIVDARGYIVTNEHVIDGATSIQVTLWNGDEIQAIIVSRDAEMDVAILKLNSTRTDFPVATLGSSGDIVVGAEVLTVGFPLGPELPGPATFTRGIISAIRNDPDTGINLIQMDAAISPGNGGGGLFTVDGKYIGIPSYGYGGANSDAENINLSIPVEIILPFITAAAG